LLHCGPIKNQHSRL